MGAKHAWQPMNIRLDPREAVLSLDSMLAQLCLPVTKEEGSLLSFLFHGLFLNSEELTSGVMDPQQAITVEMLRRFVAHFQQQSYRFVSPADVLAGLPQPGKYVLLTFDDGYYNNIRALPVLEEFGVPAVFFISSDHVELGKAFWWDVVFRELRKRGWSDAAVQRAVAGHKRFKTARVDSCLKEDFGESALKPATDLDRPFSPSELNDFAAHRLVFLGNHTKDHAILSNYTGAEIEDQVQGCQQAIRKMTGITPRMISYPDGDDPAEARRAAQRFGLQLGAGIRPGKNRLPLKTGTPAAMSLKRYTLWGNREIDMQCQTSRSAVSLYRVFKNIKPGRDSRLFPSQPV